jgi:hypothetical protein
MATEAPARTESTRSPAFALAGLLLVAATVAISLGVYGREHTPAGRPLFTLGFSSMLPMKAWLTTIALAFIAVQLVTALWMWRRLPGRTPCPPWVPPLHRWSGTTGFLITLPVAFHCLWALGFGTASLRVLAHCVVGCLFYGAYAAKMLALRLHGLPGWTLPVLGGSVFTSVVLLWLTAALWFFTRSGLPLT